MDNVRFHKGPIVLETIEIRGLEWKFLPTYTPYFNAIENCFAQWKNFVRIEEARTPAELNAAIDAAAAWISGEHCLGYVRNVHNNCTKVIEGERNMV